MERREWVLVGRLVYVDSLAGRPPRRRKAILAKAAYHEINITLCLIDLEQNITKSRYVLTWFVVFSIALNIYPAAFIILILLDTLFRAG